MGGIFRCEGCGGLNRADPARSGARCGSCHRPLRTDGAPVHLDDAALADLVAKSPVPVLVDFYADWCGPCRMLAPVLAQLGAKHAGELVVVKVDTEVHKRTAAQLGVQGIPAVFLYRDGRVVDQAAGYRPLQAWEGFLGPHLR
jgi:thioredoxin 2